MEHSSALAATVAGGVRQSSTHQTLGTATWFTSMVPLSDSTSLRHTVSLFAASGIRSFGSLTLCPFDNLTPQGSIFEKYEITQ